MLCRARMGSVRGPLFRRGRLADRLVNRSSRPVGRTPPSARDPLVALLVRLAFGVAPNGFLGKTVEIYNSLPPGRNLIPVITLLSVIGRNTFVRHPIYAQHAYPQEARANSRST